MARERRHLLLIPGAGKSLLRTCAGASLLVLAACASHDKSAPREPTRAEWDAADFGAAPAGYEATLQHYVDAALKTSNTKLIFQGEPQKVWIGAMPNFQYGYGVCAQVSRPAVTIHDIALAPTFFFLARNAAIQVAEGQDADALCSRLGEIPDGKPLANAKRRGPNMHVPF